MSMLIMVNQKPYVQHIKEGNREPGAWSDPFPPEVADILNESNYSEDGVNFPC